MFVLCVDVEPDARVPKRDGTNELSGFDKLLELLPDLRERLAAASGAAVRINWCIRMDVQIAEVLGSPAAIAESYADEFAALATGGDELGLHSHINRWDDAGGYWFSEREDEAWIRACAKLGLETFESSFGRRCAVHRSGDQFLSAAMLEEFAAHGIRVDLSVEPGQPPQFEPVEGERARGINPDYREAPALPYRPRSAADFTTPGGDAALPLEIPLLSDHREQEGRSVICPWIEPHRFAPRLDAVLEQGLPPVIALAIRSDLPLHLQWHWFVPNIEYVASHPRLRGSRFVTASEAAAELEPEQAAAA